MPAPTSIPDTTSETTTIQTGPSLMNDPPAIHNEDASPTFALESKAKRSRNVTTPYQLQVLNRVWIQTAFPDAKLRETLAKSLGMTPRAVQIWFQNVCDIILVFLV
ncbi:hypothetical protein BKA69DRAFT_636823 [Paraphysoderma sedebokerense]|nr:hypothetical protein BKA69DRAFT_636823 [Paraphysoderma sedebokerense]